MPKILLRQGVVSALLSEVEGPSLATIEYRAKHAGLIDTPLSWCWWSTWCYLRPSSSCCCFANSFVQFSVDKGKVAGDCLSLGVNKWSPLPPRECSRRWRCLECCWLLGQGCWSSWDWWWDQSRYKRLQRSWWVTVYIAPSVCAVTVASSSNSISLISTFQTSVISRRRARLKRFPSLLVWRYTPLSDLLKA